MSSFENLRIVDNFYQTSLYFPMPTVIISTLCEDGTTTLGPYSLVQPYYVAGKDYYAMLLCCRNSSNTAQNILRSGKCAINFIDDKPATFKEAVKLSWPGDKPSEKMPKCNFKLEKSMIEEENPEDKRPQVLTDAIQVIECTWVRELDGADRDLPGEFNGYEPPYHDFNGITSKFGAYFILKVDKILMKKKYSDAIINGVRAKDFPALPVDYGYRDSKNFWSTERRRCAQSFSRFARLRLSRSVTRQTARTTRSSSPTMHSRPSSAYREYSSPQSSRVALPGLRKTASSLSQPSI